MEQNGINLNDLASVVQLIDVVTARGAFRGEELSQVGALRDKIVAFLEAANAASNTNEAPAETEAS